jgi:hypothetical protein
LLKEQINSNNNTEVKSIFEHQIDAILSVKDYLELIELIVLRKKLLLKNSKDVHETDKLFAELEAGWNGCSGK